MVCPRNATPVPPPLPVIEQLPPGSAAEFAAAAALLEEARAEFLRGLNLPADLLGDATPPPYAAALARSQDRLRRAVFAAFAAPAT